ncbi:MAG TPA: hypothetical protein VNB23_07825 [Ramlibacter sp.]|nr:hypothetical protein [Ramlibacter sp.]
MQITNAAGEGTPAARFVAIPATREEPVPAAWLDEPVPPVPVASPVYGFATGMPLRAEGGK